MGQSEGTDSSEGSVHSVGRTPSEKSRAGKAKPPRGLVVGLATLQAVKHAVPRLFGRSGWKPRNNMPRTNLTAERVRELLDYNPDTGVLTWIGLPDYMADRLGKEAGNVNAVSGHRFVMIDQRNYLAHRVIWLHVHGVWPNGQIDHKNGNRDDNRLDNLRDTTPTVNAQNLHGPQKNNKTGFLGVIFKPAMAIGKQYEARIMANRRIHRLGYFETPEEAHEAYLAAKRQLHEGCTI